MLVGRDRERSLIGGVLAAARVGQGGALVLTGEAGIGKTALLDDAAASAHGMRVLRTTGTDSEAELPFGALLHLLRPALADLDGIPRPQAEALAAALALRPGSGGDRFAVGAGTLSLLSRFAEDEPLAVIVDDAHLLDPPSAQALAFAARRLAADPVALLAAAREGRAGPLTEAGLPEVRIGGLSPADAANLVTARGRRFDLPLDDRLWTATGGNPLALLELADDIPGLDALPSEAPVRVPASLARAFARRADRLSPGARTALLVAAAGGSDAGVLTAACALLDVPLPALEEAEAEGLLTLSPGRVDFRHPLVRSAVYREATPAARRAVHRALAAMAGDDADRRAWHLGEAALGPDEETARAVESAAVRARDRGAAAAAATAFERAAHLSPHTAERVERLLTAAESAWQAGMADVAVRLLTEAAGHPPLPGVRIRAAVLRGRVAARTGAVEQARDILVAAGLEAGETRPDTAIELLAEAILACFFLGDTATSATVSRSIDRLIGAAHSRTARWVGPVSVGLAAVLTGQGGPDRIRAAVGDLSPDDPLVHDPVVVPWLALCPLFLRESSTGRDLVRTVMAELRRRTDIARLPLLLFQVGRDQATTDRWDLAGASYAEGVELAREAGYTSDLAACLAGLAWLRARQGRDEECRAHAAEALEIGAAQHLGLFQAWAHAALAELDLAHGRLAPALDRFRLLSAMLDDLELVDVDLSPGPELVEVLVSTGRGREAAALAEAYADRAQGKGQPWALARAARALALVCPEAELDERFSHALELHERTPDSYERARTLLCHGMRLRRARRRLDARAPLREAMGVFEDLGAGPWADRAAAELRATGETARRRQADVLRDLTPQELRIATLLAGGRTTRETAAALFLSPKTVEYHLRHVYIKLGVSTRHELASRLDG